MEKTTEVDDLKICYLEEGSVRPLFPSRSLVGFLRACIRTKSSCYWRRGISRRRI
jgi:hypothetical protein